MRTALLSTVLMVAMAGAAADEPSVADAKAQATAESAPASERVVMIDVQDDEDQSKPYEPPPGYKPNRLNGEKVYCAKLVVLGSRYDVDRTRPICSSDNGGCGMD